MANNIAEIMSEGMIFKKGKGEASTEKKVSFKSYLSGTHHSASAKKKAEYKYKKAVRNMKKNESKKK